MGRPVPSRFHDALAGDDEHEHDDGDDPGDDEPVDGPEVRFSLPVRKQPWRRSVQVQEIGPSHTL